jgi:transcriptional regulator
MYTPPYNKLENRQELVAFLRANDFPIVITGTGGALHGTHLPVVVHDRGDRIVLDLHMAKSNPQWKEFFDEEVLVIFSGPHAYVSPRWYEDQERVPTWNYAAVHAYGLPKLFEEPKVKYENQRRLVAQLDPEWLPKFDALKPEYIDKMLAGIVNFRIDVTRIDARWKLSQNRGRREMELIADQLDKSPDTMLKALAALHRQHLVDE